MLQSFFLMCALLTAPGRMRTRTTITRSTAVSRTICAPVLIPITFTIMTASHRTAALVDARRGCVRSCGNRIINAHTARVNCQIGATLFGCSSIVDLQEIHEAVAARSTTLQKLVKIVGCWCVLYCLWVFLFFFGFFARVFCVCFFFVCFSSM